MNCETVKEMLWAYLEKETTAEEAVKIEEHLKNCESCREELKLQKEMMEALSGLPEEELPEGYHAELMQKLRAEAAPNVVPFPVKKKKKQPVWRQLSMVAAAAFVLVAAGGINGMLEMRNDQNEAVSQMRMADAPEVASLEDEVDILIEEAQDAGEMEQKAAAGKQKSAGTDTAMPQDTKMDADAAVPEMAYTAEEMNVMTRSIEVFAGETAVLLVEDMEAARTAVQAAIAAADGYETEIEAENSIHAVIPVEKYDEFVKVLETIGKLEWTQTEDTEADFYSITLQLKTN